MTYPGPSQSSACATQRSKRRRADVVTAHQPTALAMLAMETCKISDGGQLNSGTVEPFLDYGAIAEGMSVSGGPGMLLREILKSETSQSPTNTIKFTS
jgi:hypothetical protein